MKLFGRTAWAVPLGRVLPANRSLVLWQPPQPAKRPKKRKPEHPDKVMLRNFRPERWTAAGLRTGTLHKLERSRLNGKWSAYYDFPAYHSSQGSSAALRYLYQVVKGVPTAIKEYRK